MNQRHHQEWKVGYKNKIKNQKGQKKKKMEGEGASEGKGPIEGSEGKSPKKWGKNLFTSKDFKETPKYDLKPWSAKYGGD